MSCPFGHGGAPHADVETGEGVAKDSGEASGGSGKPSVGSEGYSDLFAEETQRRNLMKVKVRPLSTASCGTDREMPSHACVTAVFHSLVAHHQRNTASLRSPLANTTAGATRGLRAVFSFYFWVLHCTVLSTTIITTTSAVRARSTCPLHVALALTLAHSLKRTHARMHARVRSLACAHTVAFAVGCAGSQRYHPHQLSRLPPDRRSPVAASAALNTLRLPGAR
jgi:hypothetical protein